MWKIYFNLIKVQPGKISTFQHGTIDFSRDNLPVDLLKSLYDNKFPYLELTDLGEKELYGIHEVKPKETPKQKKKPLKS